MALPSLTVVIVVVVGGGGVVDKEAMYVCMVLVFELLIVDNLFHTLWFYEFMWLI